MKILHTSDLHLGRKLLEESLQEDQEHILKQVIQIAKEENVSAILLAGDVLDKSIPSVEAVKLLDNFLCDVTSLGISIYAISGNHDSAERLGYANRLLEKSRVHLCTKYNGKMQKVDLDANTSLYMLPFVKGIHLKEFATEEEYLALRDANSVMQWILAREEIDKSKNNILLLHQFVTNPGENLEFADSETALSVGTLDSIDVNLLKDFAYVALGHLHRPQKVQRETVRYSGTPLKYSFGESKGKKSVVILDTEDMSFSLRELSPLRDVVVYRGSMQDILEIEDRKNLARIELEEDNVISALDKIRKNIPHAISLAFVNRKEEAEDMQIEMEKQKSITELFAEFFAKQNGRPLTEKESKVVRECAEKGEEE